MVLVATQVKRRRGTTAENDAFTGAEGEIVVDTERHELRVHDGVTQGGFKIGGGSGALVIGQILEVVGTADYTPEGCLLADGAEYTKAQFPDLWENFLTGTPKLQTCTYTEYANQIAEYGFCNKFAVDTTNETFKVPTRNKYRKLVKKIINGSSWANIYDDGWCEQGGKVGGFTHTFPGTYSSEYLATTITLLSFTGTRNINCISTNGAVYANGEINASGDLELYLGSANYTASNVYIYWRVSGYIQVPDSTSNITREFVVVANGTLNQEQMDWSAWASSLAGRATTDMNNITSTGKENVFNWGLPDYTSGIQITTTAQTAPKNGWIIGYIVFSGSNVNCEVYVGGNIVSKHGWTTTGNWFGASVQIPIKAGQTFRFSTNGTMQDNKMYFYPNNE